MYILKQFFLDFNVSSVKMTNFLKNKNYFLNQRKICFFQSYKLYNTCNNSTILYRKSATRRFSIFYNGNILHIRVPPDFFNKNQPSPSLTRPHPGNSFPRIPTGFSFGKTWYPSPGHVEVKLKLIKLVKYLFHIIK